MFLLETSSQRSKGFHLILVWVQLQRKLFRFSCAVNSVKLHSGLDFIWEKGDTHTFRLVFFCILFCSKSVGTISSSSSSPCHLIGKYERPECQRYRNHTSILTQIMGKGLASGVSILGFLNQKRSSHRLWKRSTSVPAWKNSGWFQWTLNQIQIFSLYRILYFRWEKT